MLKIFAILFAAAASVSAAAAQTAPAFMIERWDQYDGSERLGLIQLLCKSTGWPNGMSARQAAQKLQNMTRADAERIAKTCDPRELNPAARTATAGAPNPAQKGKRIEHPFPKSVKNQYRCWIDAEGRHRVPRDSPLATGWCWGKAVGD